MPKSSTGEDNDFKLIDRALDNEAKRESDMNRLETIFTNDIQIRDEYSLKKYTLTPERPKEALLNKSISGLFNLITKDLALANINNEYDKWIYQMQLRNAMNWYTMGLPMLALIRLANLIGELHLERSKEGLERILQAAAPLYGAVMFKERGEYSFIKRNPQNENQQEENQGGING